MKEITLTKPDDWHLHLRDKDYLSRTVNDAAQRFVRAIVMPNLKPPMTTATQASLYRERILAAIPNELNFQPLMTLYLTEETTPAIIDDAKKSGIIYGVKLYPAGATTHSEFGVNQLEKLYPTFAAMEKQQLPLLIHGEVNNAEVDIFDREKKFLEQELSRLIREFPNLKIVLEHITTADAVEFILSAPKNVAATITVHHLLLNRNDLLAGGIKPHYYCLPVLKRQTHQAALIKAATSGNPKFFLGTDSAPHTQSTKENACGCAGIYTAHAAIELYAQVFEAANALDKLEGFSSFYGADFYGLPRNQTKITLKKEDWLIPAYLTFGEGKLIPLFANQTIRWKIVS